MRFTASWVAAPCRWSASSIPPGCPRSTAVDAGPGLAGTVGHVHLQVGEIAAAQRFYVDVIGFEATHHEYSGALFASAGGYHHHVAMNVWNSRGAGPRAATLGLGDVAVAVPSRADLDALLGRLRRAKVAFADNGRSVVTNDPWGTQVTVSTAGARCRRRVGSMTIPDPRGIVARWQHPCGFAGFTREYGSSPAAHRRRSAEPSRV